MLRMRGLQSGAPCVVAAHFAGYGCTGPGGHTAQNGRACPNEPGQLARVYVADEDDVRVCPQHKLRLHLLRVHDLPHLPARTQDRQHQGRSIHGSCASGIDDPSTAIWAHLFHDGRQIDTQIAPPEARRILPGRLLCERRQLVPKGQLVLYNQAPVSFDPLDERLWRFACNRTPDSRQSGGVDGGEPFPANRTAFPGALDAQDRAGDRLTRFGAPSNTTTGCTCGALFSADSIATLR